MKLEDIQRVIVVGAGTMGHAIAQLFAQGGFLVSLVDTQENILNKAMDLIRGNLKTLSEHGLIKSSDIPTIMERISTTTSLEDGARGADLAVEAVYENPDLKRSIFTELDRFCPNRAILTSNTSTLDIYGFVETSRPQKVVIAHWFAPPHIIPLVEVVQGDKTSEETVELVMAILKKIDKRPVHIKQFMPAFIVNRVQMAIFQSVFEMLDNGWATPEEIDLAIKASIGIRIPIVGLAQTFDFTGLDLVKAVGDLRGMSSKTLNEKVKKGHLGAKAGKGLYDYQGRSYEEILRKRDHRYIKMVRYLEEINAYETI